MRKQNVLEERLKFIENRLYLAKKPDPAKLQYLIDKLITRLQREVKKRCIPNIQELKNYLMTSNGSNKRTWNILEKIDRQERCKSIEPTSFEKIFN